MPRKIRKTNGEGASRNAPKARLTPQGNPGLSIKGNEVTQNQGGPLFSHSGNVPWPPGYLECWVTPLEAIKRKQQNRITKGINKKANILEFVK